MPEERIPEADCAALGCGLPDHHAGLHSFETPAPSHESASDVSVDAATNGAGSSPSAVASVEAALILRHTHLKDSLPKLRAEEARAIDLRRSAVDEMAQIERLLRSHARIKNPARRTRKP